MNQVFRRKPTTPWKELVEFWSTVQWTTEQQLMTQSQQLICKTCCWFCFDLGMHGCQWKWYTGTPALCCVWLVYNIAYYLIQSLILWYFCLDQCGCSTSALFHPLSHTETTWLLIFQETVSCSFNLCFSLPASHHKNHCVKWKCWFFSLSLGPMKPSENMLRSSMSLVNLRAFDVVDPRRICNIRTVRSQSSQDKCTHRHTYTDTHTFFPDSLMTPQPFIYFCWYSQTQLFVQSCSVCLWPCFFKSLTSSQLSLPLIVSLILLSVQVQSNPPSFYCPFPTPTYSLTSHSLIMPSVYIYHSCSIPSPSMSPQAFWYSCLSVPNLWIPSVCPFLDWFALWNRSPPLTPCLLCCFFVWVPSKLLLPRLYCVFLSCFQVEAFSLQFSRRYWMVMFKHVFSFADAPLQHPVSCWSGESGTL